MLVLSRREAEKVLFPKLGISVEVTRVQGKTVRLGIHAPQEIRIIRGELADEESVDPKAETSNNEVVVDPSVIHREIQKNLDAANLAIHLAQNQLRQRLSDRAELALAHALECLEKLEIAISTDLVPGPTQLTVHEGRSSYNARSKPMALVIDADDPKLKVKLSDCLTDQGYCVVVLDNTSSLVDHLQMIEQPAVVFTIEAFLEESPDSDGDEPAPELRVEGVSGLHNSKRFSFGQNWINGWFAVPDSAETLVRCLQHQV